MRVKEYLRRKVALFASVIEIAISIIVLIAIVIAGIQVVREVFSLAGDPKAHEGFTVFLGHAFNLIIGVALAIIIALILIGASVRHRPADGGGAYFAAGKSHRHRHHRADLCHPEIPVRALLR